MKFGLVTVVIVYVIFLLDFPSVPMQYSMGGDYAHPGTISNLIFSLLKLGLDFLPFLGILILMAILLVLIIKKSLASYRPVQFLTRSTNFWQTAMVILSLIAFSEFAMTNYFVLDHLPHVPDAIAYAHQAKLFAQGKLFLKLGDQAKHFPLVGMIDFQGKQFSQYSFGHPLVLSLGYRLGLPWLIPPLMGVLALNLIYQIGIQVYSRRIGLIVAILAFISPFIKMNSASFMSHNTALVFTLLTIWWFIKFIKTQNYWLSFGTGLALGFLVNIRPFTGFLVALPLGLFSLKILLVEPKNWLKNLRLFGPLMIGLTLMLLSYFGYNKILTGSWTTSTYDLGFLSHFGIDATRTWAMALTDSYTNLYLLNKVLLGWPGSLSFLFILVFIVTSPPKKWEWLFSGLIVAILGGYFFYKGSWMMYGPRFWYETTPFWLFLIVAGIEKFPQMMQKIVPTFVNHNFKFYRQMMLILIYLLVFGLGVRSLVRWYQLTPSTRWQNDFTPENLGEMKNFNYANSYLMTEITRQKIHQAVVFIKHEFNWWEYGVPAYFMDLSFQDDIIYALDLGDDENLELINQYPTRTFYRADYDAVEISPYLIKSKNL